MLEDVQFYSNLQKVDTYLWRIGLNVFNYWNQFAKTTNLDGSVEIQGSILGFSWLKQTKNNDRIQKSLNRTFCQLQNNNYRVTRLLQQNQCLDLFLWTKWPKIICSAYKEAHQIVLDLKTTKHCLKTLDQNQAVLALRWGDDSKHSGRFCMILSR